MFVCERPIFELASHEFVFAGFNLAEQKSREPTHSHSSILQLGGIRKKTCSIFVTVSPGYESNFTLRL